ncbi:MAG TPA: serine hydrolase domain-containing protein [Candidatus Limnocylindria bacterium]|nr:serine hydrolase domain-containing protein [Candidatus Limnocylindria bacterium]
MKSFAVALLAAFLWQGCNTTPPPSFAFKPEKLSEIDALLKQGIADHRMPGAVFWIEHQGVAYHEALGQRALRPVEEDMTEDTIFDAASLTKVLATAPAIMLLAERGALDIEAPVQKYIEEFRRNGKDNITVRQLLTHTSGLRSGLSKRPEGQRAAIGIACQETVTNVPGTVFIYSDINFILLGEIVQRVDGRPLEELVREEIYRPLRMKDTRYLPWSIDHTRIAPTERDGTNMLRGVVHDPTARRMSGVAGHAGLFTTAADVARFARMMLNGGELDGVRVFHPQTVSAMTSVQSPAGLPRRGFGWDIDSGYSRRGEIFPLGSYGHTGFTGTAMWIDPFSKTFWILLTNRVHPDGKGNILSLQKWFSTLAAGACGLESTASGTGGDTNSASIQR